MRFSAVSEFFYRLQVNCEIINVLYFVPFFLHVGAIIQQTQCLRQRRACVWFSSMYLCLSACVQCFWQSNLRFGSLEHIILWLQLWLAKWCKNPALHHLCNVVHFIPKTSEVFVHCHHFLVKAGERTAVFWKSFFKMLWNNSFTITLLHRVVGDTCPQKNAVTLVHHLRYLTLTCLSIQKD